VPLGAIWVAGVIVVLGVCGLAARAAQRRGDHLALLVTIELLGLLISPISWEHYWVWIVPFWVWAWYGPACRSVAVRVAAGVWLLLTYSSLVKRLSQRYPSDWDRTHQAVVSYPWYIDVLAWGYTAGTLLVCVSIWLSLTRIGASAAPSAEPAA